MSRSTYDPHSNYPPSPPPSRSRRAPPLRVNTQSTAPSSSSIRSAGHSPVKPGFSYNLPANIDSSSHAQSRARPGGLAALNGDVPNRVKSPPITPGSRSQSRSGHWSRRGSNESTIPPAVLRQGSDQSAFRTRKDNGQRSPPLPSVYSGREGMSQHRVEGIRSPNPALFAHHCRLFYFSPSPPEDSASYISTTLASLPPSHRAAYTRLQSSLRSLAHLHHLRLRISSFHALISSTIASASLTPLARQDLVSPQAKAERTERAQKFISTWCTSKTGGVEPFFRGLWGVLRAQSRGESSRGGAGSTRVVWEIDDAVFLESGGTEFMHEAVSFLKGVLGFEEQPLTSPPKLRRIRTLPRSYSDARSRQFARPSPKKMPSTADSQEELAPSPPDKSRKADSRSRAISDPFTDIRSNRRGPAPPPPPSRRHPSTIPNPLQRGSSDDIMQSSNPDSPLLGETVDATLADPHFRPAHVTARISEDRIHLLGRRTLSETSEYGSGHVASGSIYPEPVIEDDEEEPTEADIAAEEADLNKPRFRLWVFPAHISDQEAERLKNLFPRFISSKGDVRFPFVRPGRGVTAMEEARWDAIAVGTVEDSEPKLIRIPKVEIEDEEGVVRCGTGRMWVGIEFRRAGWQGSGWYRFKRWWRRLFGMA
ncbi:uncharacterized protein I206_104943 [Kwoniella pini CBS 10737]|uniref:Uncharacterized protein n=1 Tax=Kwoniella pini CBS 10737 TaxID=1296096 RepID=A0A1B9I8D6_9TREE|nr:uncharacterized protein I206_02482 [Kwoniella pini CBS 10737]OCF51766.1 hypothetical protein I206_02482 [Kwoniella pini CBS 10737]